MREKRLARLRRHIAMLLTQFDELSPGGGTCFRAAAHRSAILAVFGGNG
jgi:hypothetical protein